MRKIILINQKGGCGKTTTAINLACGLSDGDKRVLLLDLDPQGHVALGLGFQADRMNKTIYEVLTEKITIFEAVQPIRENLDGIFSNVVLSALEPRLAGSSGKEYKLAEQLSEIEKLYDYLIIDSPPNIGLLTINGLIAASEAIIPVDPSPFSLHGLSQLLDTLRLMKSHTAHELNFNILASNVDRRTNFGNALIETLRSRFPTESLKTVINTSTRVREAASQGCPVRDIALNSSAAADFSRLTKEVIDQESPASEKQNTKKIVFTIEAPANNSVHLAGDFTDWKPIPLNLKKNSDKVFWQKAIRLKPGTYQYKYLVNNDWVPDPANNNVVSNGFGGANSCLEV